MSSIIEQNIQPTNKFECSNELLKENIFFIEVLNNMSDIALVTDNDRKVLFANRALLNMINVQDEKSILNRKPGEILSCINADKSIDGCGASNYCKYCGILKAILKTQKTKEKVVDEVIITIENDSYKKTIDWLISATTWDFKNDTYTIISFTDISDKKRKDFLEKIFFHDAINKAGGMYE